jgi:hypothetical protein
LVSDGFHYCGCDNSSHKRSEHSEFIEQEDEDEDFARDEEAEMETMKRS